MNPLGISVAFVICSIMLSFLKKSIFEDSQATSSVLKINKIFQLSNNEVVTQHKHYKSLYEAYYKYEMPDASKAANNYWNRSRFNQSVLGSELGNGQNSFLCGIDYLLVINSGIQLDSQTNPSFQNTLTLYKLPFLTPLAEQKLQGKLIFPQKCKQIKYDDESMQQEQQNNYEIILNNKETFIRLIINQIGIHVKVLDKQRGKSKDGDKDGNGGVVCYDFVGEIVGGWVGDRPWVVVVWDFYGQGQLYQINILADNIGEVSNKAHRIQVTQILLQNPNKQAILTIVYKHQHTETTTQNLTLLVYKLNNDNDNDHNNENNSVPQLVHRSIIDIDYPKYHYPNPTCSAYWNSIQSSFDLSCIIHKNRKKLYKFVNFPDFDHRKEGEEEEGQEEEWVQGKGMGDGQGAEREEEEEGWMSNIFGQDQEEEYSGQQQDDDEQINREVEVSRSQYKKKKRVQLTFKNPQQSRKHLIKPSTPPLVYYQQNKKHYILMFTMPEHPTDSPQQLQLQYLLYELTPPPASASSSSNSNSNGKQENEIKSIKLISKQNCFLVVWTNSLEIYSYDVVSINLDDIQGVDVIVILPFLELFATVYCILRTIWTND